MNVSFSIQNSNIRETKDIVLKYDWYKSPTPLAYIIYTNYDKIKLQLILIALLCSRGLFSPPKSRGYFLSIHVPACVVSHLAKCSCCVGRKKRGI